MPIISYVPPKKNIHDNRTPNGGYYTAKCDNCGTAFYPKRSNAKYCTPNCALISHRQAIASGKTAKTEKQKAKTSKKPKLAETGTYFIGANNVYQYLKANYDTRGQKEIIIQSLLSLVTTDIDETDTYQFNSKIYFQRESERKYFIISL